MIRLRAVFGLSLALLLALGSLRPAYAQFNPREMALSDLHTAAIRGVQTRQFKASLPYLNELIARLRGAEEEASWKVLGWAMFQTAIAHMETDKVDQALVEFNAYIKRFPQGPYVKPAWLLQGEIHATREQWPEVRRVIAEVLKHPLLKITERVWASQLVGESYYREQNWAECVPPFTYVIKNTRNADTRNLAAVHITTALVRVGNYPDLFRFLPHVYRTSARYDIGLNMALIEAGDRSYDEEKFVYALSLYRLVYTKAELRENLTARTASAVQRKKTLWNQPDLEAATILGLQRNLQRLLKDLQAQSEELETIPDYDQELIIRLATTYLNLQRYWEALIQFRRVYDTYPHHELAEQGLYSAYTTAVEMGNPERALAEGYDYLEAYPLGTYWERLTVSIGQLHVARKEYAECLELAAGALKIKPDHTLKPHLLYLMGYSRFNRNEPAPALDHFTALLRDHPGSAFEEDATYWSAMCHLFQNHYTPAREGFETFLAAYPRGLYTEDATFRYAVGFYGEGNYELSAGQLKAFLTAFPDSRLVAEAHCMLGDITASWTQLDTALAHYAQVPDLAVNMTEVNYAAFQSARVYELESRFDAIIALFRDYITRYGEEGNFSQALYWIGNAYFKSERPEDGYQTFLDGIVKYGNVPEHDGIDMILRDLIAEQESLRGTPEYERFMKQLYKALAAARRGKQKTLELRLITLFSGVMEPGLNRDKLISVLMLDQYLDQAGPLTLAVIGRDAAARNKPDTSRAAYQTLLDKFGKTDFTVDALQGMATVAANENRHADAAALLAELIDRYPTLPHAADAQKQLGDLLRIQSRWDQAIQTYNVLLGVREWRGPLFPEALYWIGECHWQAGRIDEAFAHFQRVYVLYGAYDTWVARAYLRSADCLVKLKQTTEARTTLEEMLGIKALQSLPEHEQARQALNRLKGGNA